MGLGSIVLCYFFLFLLLKCVTVSAGADGHLPGGEGLSAGSSWSSLRAAVAGCSSRYANTYAARSGGVQ